MAGTQASTELKTYKGACHCGAIKFSVSSPVIKSVTECNCSICSKKGYAWVFPPAGGLVFEEGKGEEFLKDYEFAGKKMAHRFCSTCGTGVMGKRHNTPAGMDIGVNVRTLEDVDVWELEVNKYDGASLEPKYTPHKFVGPEPTVEVENAKMYYGSCHCGATTIALKNKGPLDSKTDIRECNCSICYKRSLIHTYPLLPQFSIVTDPAHPLTPYIFGRKMQHHMFCSNCGVQVYIRKLACDQETYRLFGRPGSTEELKEGSEELEKEFTWWGTWTPINMRVFEGVQWGGTEGLDVKKTHWKGFLQGVEFLERGLR